MNTKTMSRLRVRTSQKKALRAQLWMLALLTSNEHLDALHPMYTLVDLVPSRSLHSLVGVLSVHHEKHVRCHGM